MARLLWHPRKENRFVVGSGSRITLYELASEYPEIRQITAQSDLQLMKCFAWSPHPVDDLFAVGLSTGKVDLIRLEGKDAYRTNALSSSKPITSLPQRNSRACNTLAFCANDLKSLAVGLDKVRGDCSLVIWDINSALPVTALRTSVPDGGIAPVLSKSQSAPRIPRIEMGGRGADPRLLQQHCPAEVVSAMSFLPDSSNLLLAGLSHRWLRLFDLRSPTPPPVNVASKVHGITTDPLDSNRVACFGDGSVTIWDMRRFVYPLLTFSERDALADGAQPKSGSAYSHIEFSNTRRGQLATLERDGAYVRFWDTSQSKVTVSPVRPKEMKTKKSTGNNDGHSLASRKSWATIPWIPGATVTSSSANAHDSEHGSLILCDTRKTTNFSPALASFAYVPPSQSGSLVTNVMTLNTAGDLELGIMYDTPKQLGWSSQGELLLGGGRALRLIPGLRDSGSAISEKSPADHPPSGDVLSYNEQRTSSDLRAAKPRKSRDGERHQLPSPGLTPSHHSVHRHTGGRKEGRGHHSRRAEPIPGEDILMTMKHRALKGYDLGNQNVSVLKAVPSSQTESHFLPEVWNWISHAQDFLYHPSPKVHKYDFTYQGVLSIWEGFSPMSEISRSHSPLPSGVPPQTRKHKRHSHLARSAAEEDQDTFNAALQTLISRRDGHRSNWKPAVPTSRPLHRQAALRLCGWSLQENEMSSLIKRWERSGCIPRAVCWLVLTKQNKEAIELLMRSKDESHTLLSGTLAALFTSSSTNPSKSTELRAHCERLSSRLQDPYFRVVLVHLSHGDWSEVIQEEAIPFHERLAIALQFFDDKALTSYLHRCVTNSIRHGHIDGLIVSGLTQSGFAILQSYVDHTSDVQSAAILSSLVCPMKFTDERAERWLDAYRDVLDGFKLFSLRVNFDIQRGQLLNSAIKDGSPPAASHHPPPQILIRCNYCNKSISLVDVASSKPTSCIHCGRDLPRCAICLLTLSVMQEPGTNDLAPKTAPFRDAMGDAIVICQTCRHGGHSSHILQWFFAEDGTIAHDTCPVASCNCKCANEL